MTVTRPFHLTPKSYLVAEQPDDPVLFLSPEILADTARRFLDGFPGLVTYAVKANAAGPVIENLVRAGLSAFDVASPAEIALVRSIAPEAALHYNNPVRSRAEIDAAIGMGVTSYSVDVAAEFAKLVEAGVAPGAEMTVRFKLPVAGAAYDFGEKFGATPDAAVELLRAVVGAGYRPSLTFHPGTQCTDPGAWVSYVDASAEIARKAGVTLDRLNVGGGFPSRRMQADAPPLEAIFEAIGTGVTRAFGASRPALICEPGRAMVAEAVSLALRVKALRPGMVYLNDGIYGALAEQPVMGMTDRLAVMAPDGTPRTAGPEPRLIWGPTCDSLDRMPGKVALPADLSEGDYVLIHGMGAYSTATITRFNGYGAMRLATVRTLA